MRIKTLGVVRSSGLNLGPLDFDWLATGNVHSLEKWRGIIKQGEWGGGRNEWEACRRNVGKIQFASR